MWKEINIEITETCRNQDSHNQKITNPQHSQNPRNPTQWEKFKRYYRKQIIYENRTICITSDFSTQTLKSKRVWNEGFQVPKGEQLPNQTDVSYKTITQSW